MDKTFRVLLIASIVIAISMGLSAFKKSKKNDVVVKEQHSVLDKQAESKDALVTTDEKTADKSMEDHKAGGLDKNQDKALSEGTTVSHEESHDIKNESNKESGDAVSSDTHDKTTEAVETNTEHKNLAYNHESMTDDVDHNESKDASSSNDLSELESGDTSKASDDIEDDAHSKDDMHSKEDNSSIDAKSELVPIG
jgi:hypothetical protein